MNLQKFPRYPLTFGPSPITPLPRLSAHLGGKVHLYAKREDCNSGLAFGGNKTRKLEYLIPEAIAGGYDTLVSIGGIQSNQTRQVAAVAAHLGMKCVLVQENWVNYSDAVYDRVGNIEMSRIMGADVRLDAAGFDIGIRPSWEQAMDDVKKAGGKPFPIPAGCSEHTYGGLVREIFQSFGIAKIDGVLLRFAGAYQREDTGAVDAVEIVCRGRHTEIDSGNAKAGDKSELKVKSALTYYKLSVNGSTDVEIDLINMIEIVNGVDRLAEQRAAIGL